MYINRYILKKKRYTRTIHTDIDMLMLMFTLQ